MTLRPWRPCAILLAAALGCGAPPAGGTADGPTGQQTADDVAAMLKEHFEATRRAPAGVDDLADAPASHPVGHAAVASQAYVVVWRAPVSAAGSGAVLAYQKDVPASGGFVVMQDGSVKQMSADEFKAAPKAK